jgi:hypothetical protein
MISLGFQQIKTEFNINVIVNHRNRTIKNHQPLNQPWKRV